MDDVISRIGVDIAIESSAQKAKGVVSNRPQLTLFNLHLNP